MPEIAVWIKPKDDPPNALVQYSKECLRGYVLQSTPRPFLGQLRAATDVAFLASSPAAAANVELPVEIAFRRRHRALAPLYVRGQVLRARLAVTYRRLMAIHGPHVALTWGLRRLAGERDRDQHCRDHGS
jgi:hypothetical protein